MSPRSLSLRFAVSSGQTVELGKSRDADLLQRDLELPWREKVPRSQRRAQQTRLQEQRCPSRSLPNAFVFSCLPPSPRFPTSHCGWGATEERPGPGERISALKSRAPPRSSVGRGGEQIKRGREGSPGIQTTAAKRQARGTAAGERCRSNSAGSGARPGCQACKCRTERKNKTKQKKNPKQPKKKEPTETSRTPEECNATTPSWRALQGGGWRSWVSNAVNSFRVIPPSTLPCNSDPSVEV